MSRFNTEEQKRLVFEDARQVQQELAIARAEEEIRQSNAYFERITLLLEPHVQRIEAILKEYAAARELLMPRLRYMRDFVSVECQKIPLIQPEALALSLRVYMNYEGYLELVLPERWISTVGDNAIDLAYILHTDTRLEVHCLQQEMLVPVIQTEVPTIHYHRRMLYRIASGETIL